MKIVGANASLDMCNERRPYLLMFKMANHTCTVDRQVNNEFAVSAILDNRCHVRRFSERKTKL